MQRTIQQVAPVCVSPPTRHRQRHDQVIMTGPRPVRLTAPPRRLRRSNCRSSSRIRSDCPSDNGSQTHDFSNNSSRHDTSTFFGTDRSARASGNRPGMKLTGSFASKNIRLSIGCEVTSTSNCVLCARCGCSHNFLTLAIRSVIPVAPLPVTVQNHPLHFTHQHEGLHCIREEAQEQPRKLRRVRRVSKRDHSCHEFPSRHQANSPVSLATQSKQAEDTGKIQVIGVSPYLNHPVHNENEKNHKTI